MSATAEAHAHPHHATEGGDDTILEHHYDDLEQQHESSMLGMWTFLATEVMFFGGLVGAYIIYRIIYRDDFAAAGRHQNVILGGINTVILLTSSLTMALAVRAAQLRRIREIVIYLVATMVFGAGFLGVKAIEYTTDYREGLFPFAGAWDWEKAQAHSGHAGEHEGESKHEELGESNSTISPKWYATIGTTTPDPAAAKVLPLRNRSQSDHAKLYFTFYFFMTGLHAIHLIIGIVLVGIMALLSWRRWFSGAGETQIETTGLYWHFVDVVWVYLYPALYLIDIHQ